MSIKGMPRKNLNDLLENGSVGDWLITEITKDDQPYLVMFLRYPISDEEWLKWHEDTQENNRGDVVKLPLSGSGHPVWQWDGNQEAPTISPSILICVGDGFGGRKELWHGWLRNGELINA